MYAKCLATSSYLTILVFGMVHWYSWLEATATMSVTTRLVFAAFTTFFLLALWEATNILKKEGEAESMSEEGGFRATVLYTPLVVALFGIALDDWRAIEEWLRELFPTG
jgi:hypothetical protein